MEPDAHKVGIFTLRFVRRLLAFSAELNKPTMEGCSIGGSDCASPWADFVRELLTGTPMQVIQALMLLFMESPAGSSSLCRDPKPSSAEVQPAQMPSSEPLPASEGREFRTMTKPGSSRSQVSASTIHCGARFPWTMSVTAGGPDRNLELIRRFRAEFVAKPGQAVACNVELLRSGYNRRRLRITKSDSQAVLVDCEINQKSKAKVSGPAKVQVLAETKQGSGRLAICSLGFGTERDAQTFVEPFQ
jgi:hypothetical protein